MNRAAVVVGGPERLEIQQDVLARCRHVTVGDEAAHAVVHGRRGGRVVEVNEAVRRKLRVERDAEQSALTRRIDGQRHERVRQKDAVLDDAKRAVLLADEEAPVRSKGHGRRLDQACRNGGVGESHRHGGRHGGVGQE